MTNIKVEAIIESIENLAKMKDLMGMDNTVYRGMVEGINREMNVDLEDMLSDPYKKEALVAEIIVQKILAGDRIDQKSVQEVLEFDHWKDMVDSYVKKANMS